MVTAIKPLMSGRTKQTFLDPFHLADKAACFERNLKLAFIKGTDKNMTTFTMGCEKETALVYAKNRKEDYVEVEMSAQLLEISKIQDINVSTVFASNEKTFGWFIFVDKNIFANWGHECKYIFYINEEIVFEERRLLPPDAKFPMEVVG